MPQIQFNSEFYECGSDESVLDCLLRHSLDVPHACKKGTCHSCKMQVTEGQVSETSQRGLKDTEIAQGFFLPCSCVPKKDLTLVLPGDSSPSFETEVIEKKLLCKDVMRLQLTLPDGFEYRAGQFINLFKNESTIRSYSIVSVPSLEDYIELHIKRIPGGQVSNWIHDELQPGQKFRISNAIGDCFYIEGRPDQNLLLIGTGTGLAPLFGIVRQALLVGHSGDIHLFHGSATADGLYYVDELRDLARDMKNFHYVPCVSREQDHDGFTHGRANDLALQQFPDLKGWRAFLCGNPSMIEKTKLKIYLAGASLNDILTDPFIIAGAPGE